MHLWLAVPLLASLVAPVFGGEGPSLRPVSNPSRGQSLKWTPYRPADRSQVSPAPVVVAARTSSPRLAQAGSTANPMSDPFGDGLDSAGHSEPGPDQPTDAGGLPGLPSELGRGTPGFDGNLLRGSESLPTPSLGNGLGGLGPLSMQPGGPTSSFECPDASDKDFYKPIREVTTDIATSEGEIPKECRIGTETFVPRAWAPTTVHWTASSLCHKPLYFEDVHLERYGHSWGPYLQPVLSGAHFFASIPLLPYHMGLYPPHECIYSLGYYRPGSCAPYMLDPIPLSVRAGLMQAGAVVGVVSIFP